MDGVNDLLEPADDVSNEDLPPRFDEARERVCAVIERSGAAGIPADTVLAALMAELMPRLVEAYGPDNVATVLTRLASEIANGEGPPVSIQ